MMPLIVKDFTWRQTTTAIYLTVKIPGIRSDKSSFVTGDNYIRLHYPPYYFEVFLWGEVDEVNGKCTLDEKECQVVFEMPKQTPDVEWPTLDLKDLPRNEKHEKRVRAVDLSQKRATQELDKALARRQEQRQMSIHEQLRLDDEARRRIAAIKMFDTRTALEQLREWQEAEETHSSSSTEDSDAEQDPQHPIDLNPTENKEAAATISANMGKNGNERKKEKGEENDKCNHCPLSHPIKVNSGNLVCDKDETMTTETETETNKCLSFEKKLDEPKKPIWNSAVPTKTKPGESSSTNTTIGSGDSVATANCRPIRAGGSITVSFTPREFPTPSRESTALEEEEWLKKQREAMRKSGFNDADLRPEERDPTWLLQKGESLMTTGSYLGAVSAFTTGLKLAPKMPELYAARASSHFALSNYRKAVEDASQALGMFTPKVAMNAKDRLKAHTCRGNAFNKLGLLPEALGDLTEALKLDPSNSELQESVKETQVETDKEALLGDETSSEDETNSN